MNSNFKNLLFFCLLVSPFIYGTEMVTIAILAKDKEPFLPFFLGCIENQTYPKKNTNLYIRTNNNNDKTAIMLKQWVNRVGHLYAEVYFDDTDVPEQVQRFAQHEWNYERFKVLGRIRQESVQWAYEHNSHYFVIDCDNFIIPKTLESILSVNLPIVAPLLLSNCRYSNYHSGIDVNGYNIDTPTYDYFVNREIRGLIEMPVVHCTYLVRYEYLPEMSYDDNSYRYEYVIFSDVARKKGIPQYLDTREEYGRLTLGETKDDLFNEPWFNSFIAQNTFLLKFALCR